MKEEEPEEEIKEVKAEMEEVAVEDARGGGVLVVTPWLRGQTGLSHANQRNVLTLLWVQAALDKGYSPDAPLFSSPDVAYVTCARHFAVFCGTGSGTRLGWGGWGGASGTQGGMDMETPAGKTLVPHPRTNWCRGLDAK